MYQPVTLCCVGVVGKTEQTAARPRKWGKSRPYHGRVVAVQGLCNLTSHDDKDTIRVEIDLGESGLQYSPGDALGVYPLNCHQVLVDALFEELFKLLGLMLAAPKMGTVRKIMLSALDMLQRSSLQC